MYNNYNITTKYLDCDESFSFEQNNVWEYAEEDDDERKYDAKEARHKDSDRKERCKKQRDKKEDEKERGRGKKPPLKPHERPIMTDKEVLATGNVLATGSVYQLSGNRGMAASQASTNTASCITLLMNGWEVIRLHQQPLLNLLIKNTVIKDLVTVNGVKIAVVVLAVLINKGYVKVIVADGALVVVKIAANVAVETTRLEMTSDFN